MESFSGVNWSAAFRGSPFGEIDSHLLQARHRVWLLLGDNGDSARFRESLALASAGRVNPLEVRVLLASRAFEQASAPSQDASLGLWGSPPPDGMVMDLRVIGMDLPFGFIRADNEVLISFGGPEGLMLRFPAGRAWTNFYELLWESATAGYSDRL